jgi:hypothetical protein
VRRSIILLISASIGVALALSATSDAATKAPPTHHASTRLPRTSGCSGTQYPRYSYSQSGYVTSDESKPPLTLDVIKVPSYAPLRSVVSQWPEGCAPTYRSPVTIYLFVSSGPLMSLTEMLPLTKEPPIRSECLIAVTSSADGNDYPLTCSGDRVNVAAWESYAELLPRLFTLGRVVTRCQVYEAEKRPALSREESLTIPEIEATYELASAYYGWKVGVPSLAATPPAWASRCAKS